MAIDISIILPVYNVQDYIKEALQSVLIQDPPFLKIIVIDDGSTDKTRQVIQSIGDPRIHYHFQENQGLGPARNAGIDFADSEYLYFMDGDDVLAEDATMQIQNIILNAVDKPDAVLFSAIDFNHETGEICESSDYFKRRNLGSFLTGREALLQALRAECSPAPAWLYVFKRSVLEREPKLRFLNIIHEDEVFTPELLIRCGPISVTNLILYKRRVRAGSIMTAQPGEKNVAGLFVSAQKWIDRRTHASEEDRIYYTREGHKIYCRAIRTASHAKIGLWHTMNLAARFAPSFSKYVRFDYIIGIFSKRLAHELAMLRTRFFTINIF